MSNTINLGNEVRDKITGFTGIVICIAEYLNKCIRIEVQPKKLNKDNTMLDSKFFDLDQLEFINDGLAQPKKAYTGGGPNPPTRNFPRR